MSGHNNVSLCGSPWASAFFNPEFEYLNLTSTLDKTTSQPQTAQSQENSLTTISTHYVK